jgi:peptide/nickel transport system substrate-binding protein
MTWNQHIGRRALLKVAMAAPAAYWLSGCSVPSPIPGTPVAALPAAPAAGTGPTIRMLASAAQGLFEAPQPSTVRTGPGILQMSYLFDTLTWRDSTEDPIPWLAEKWTSSPEGTEWTFNLRSGVKFHDGQPLTVEDVVFSYKYVTALPSTYIGSLTVPVKDVQAMDDRTVRIILKEPYAPFLYDITSYVPIMPRSIWSGVSDPLKFTDPKAFIGSGPYTLGAMNPADSSFLFVANDSFFLGKPYVRRLEYVPAGDDLVALKAGKLDMVSPNVAQGLSNDVMASFKGDPKFAVLQASGGTVTALHFNLSRGAPYNDVQFRRAVAYAIDRQEMVNRIANGNAEVGSAGFLPSGNPYASTDVEKYAYDPAKAKSLLDAAGCADRNGQRQLPNGSPLTLSLLFASTLSNQAEFIRSQLAQVGLKVELRAADPGTASQQQGAGNYDVAIVTYGGFTSDPDFLAQTYCRGEDAKFWWKAWGYSNQELNQLATAQRAALDKEKRRAILNQMQRIISQDVPIMPLYYPTRFLIYVPSVFDAWYYTPLWTPLANNKHAFVTGCKTGIAIRQG